MILHILVAKLPSFASGKHVGGKCQGIIFSGTSVRFTFFTNVLDRKGEFRVCQLTLYIPLLHNFALAQVILCH